MRVAPAIELSSAARAELEKFMRRRTTSLRVAERCRIVLLASEGLQDKQIGELIHVAPRMAALWRSRFIELGVDGLLKDAPRSGRVARWRARRACLIPGGAGSGVPMD